MSELQSAGRGGDGVDRSRWRVKEGRRGGLTRNNAAATPTTQAPAALQHAEEVAEAEAAVPEAPVASASASVSDDGDDNEAAAAEAAAEAVAAAYLEAAAAEAAAAAASAAEPGPEVTLRAGIGPPPAAAPQPVPEALAEALAEAYREATPAPAAKEEEAALDTESHFVGKEQEGFMEKDGTFNAQALTQAPGGMAWFMDAPDEGDDAGESEPLDAETETVLPPEALLGFGVPGQGFLSRSTAFKKRRGSAEHQEANAIAGRFIPAKALQNSPPQKAEAAGPPPRPDADPPAAPVAAPAAAPPSTPPAPQPPKPAPAPSPELPNTVEELKRLVHEKNDGLFNLRERYEGEIGALTKEAKQQAKREEALVAQVRGLTVELTQFRMREKEISKELEDSKQMKQLAEDRLKKGEGSVETLMERVVVLETAVKNLDTEKEALRKRFEAEQEHADRLAGQADLGAAKLRAAEGKVEALARAGALEKKRAEAYGHECEQLAGTLRRIQREWEASQAAAREQQTHLDRTAAECRALEEASAEKAKLIRTVTSHNEGLNQQLALARHNVDLLEAANSRLRGELVRVQGEMGHLEKKCTVLEAASLTFQTSGASPGSLGARPQTAGEPHRRWATLPPFPAGLQPLRHRSSATGATWWTDPAGP